MKTSNLFSPLCFVILGLITCHESESESHPEYHAPIQITTPPTFPQDTLTLEPSQSVAYLAGGNHSFQTNDDVRFRRFRSDESSSYVTEDEGSDLEETAIIAKEAGLILAGASSKLLLKFAVFILAKFPFLVTAILPGITSFYFLIGVLFGRLTAGVINPTTTSTTTTTAATTRTGVINLFFGTNLSGTGTQLSAPVGTCVDFPTDVDNQISSFQLITGTCVLICDPTGCTGSCYRITETTTVNDLGSFSQVMSSLMFC